MNYEPNVGDMVLFGKNEEYLTVANLNTITNIDSRFNWRPVHFPEGVTFAACTSAQYAFLGSLIDSFPDSVTFEHLQNGWGMFMSANKLRRLSPNMLFKNLTNGNSLFPDCSSLEALPTRATFEKMTKGRYAFARCGKLHTLPETINLHSLGASSEEMCSGTSLDEASVLRILDDENGIQPKNGGSFPINIGKRTLWKDSEAVAAKLGTTTPINAGTYSYKGWTLKVEG